MTRTEDGTKDKLKEREGRSERKREKKSLV